MESTAEKVVSIQELEVYTVYELHYKNRRTAKVMKLCKYIGATIEGNITSYEFEFKGIKFNLPEKYMKNEIEVII